MAKFKPGESGNPAGRPAGNSLQKQLRDAVGQRFDELVTVLVDAAAAGDMTAMNLIMSRMIPAIRPASEPVTFPLVGETMTERANSILDAISVGELAPDTGKSLLDGVGSVVKIEDSEHVQRQLELIKLTLEAETRAKPQ